MEGYAVDFSEPQGAMGDGAGKRCYLVPGACEVSFYRWSSLSLMSMGESKGQESLHQSNIEADTTASVLLYGKASGLPKWKLMERRNIARNLYVDMYRHYAR